MSRRRRYAVIAALGLGAISGCATLPFGSGAAQDRPAGVSYENMTARALFEVAPEKAESAALEAMNGIGCDGIQVEPRPEGGTRMTGRLPDHRHVEVTLTPSGHSTAVTAHVGRFGDEYLSIKFLKRMGSRAGVMAPEAEAAPTHGAPARPAPAPGVPDAVMLREQGGGTTFQDGIVP